MVTFTCNACGSSLKKNKVEQHFHQCRSASSVSCIDCNKDFNRQSFKAHIACISEDQKYGGADYKPKENSNKGQVKQDMWLEAIQTHVGAAQVPHAVQVVIDRVLEFDNIPRKKPKFINFLKNCVKIHNSQLQTQVWNLFETANAEFRKAGENTKSDKVQKDETTGQKRPASDMDLALHSVEDKATNNVPKKKKKKLNEIEIEPQEQNSIEETSAVKNFNMKRIIKQILKDADGNEIKLKRLRKKVLAEWSLCSDKQHLSEEDLYSKLNDKLKKNSKIQIIGGSKVKLVK